MPDSQGYDDALAEQRGVERIVSELEEHFAELARAWENLNAQHRRPLRRRHAVYWFVTTAISIAPHGEVPTGGVDMFQLTRAATSHVAECRRAQGLDTTYAPRFVGCGRNITLEFRARAAVDDLVVAGEDGPIFVAPDAARRLERATLDARDEDDDTILVIRERWLAAPGTDWVQ